MNRSISEVSGKKKVIIAAGKRSTSKQHEVPEPISAPPKAFQAPSKPEIRLQNISQKPMKFTMSKSKTTVQTPSKPSGTFSEAVKPQKRSSVTRQNLSNQKPVQS